MELPLDFPGMSSVHGVAYLDHLPSNDLRVIVRGFRFTPFYLWKVLVHAAWADAMAEVQRAVLHEELLDRLPEPFAVADRFAVAAGAD